MLKKPENHEFYIQETTCACRKFPLNMEVYSFFSVIDKVGIC